MSRLTLAVRQGVRGFVNPALIRLRARRYSPTEALVIAGHFRSGTTWLAELIANSVDGGILFEPFHIDHVPEAKAAGFTYQNFRRHDESWPDGERFVGELLEARKLNPWIVSHIPVTRAIGMQRLVVKLVAANQMLAWLTSNFDIPPVALIVRHPCAVLSSWLSRGWGLNTWINLEPGLTESYPEIVPIVDSLEHEEEFFAARWCIDHFVPFKGGGDCRFNVVAYEKLVMEGADYLEDVLQAWDLEVPAHVRDSIRRPSEKASDTMRSSYDSVLTGWQDKLTQTQVARVLRVVRDFGLDFYDDSPEPDYDRLREVGKQEPVASADGAAAQ